MSLDHHLEAFVAAIVAGETKAAAWRAAYPDRYARNPTQNADRILARRAVRARLAALGVAQSETRAAGTRERPKGFATDPGADCRFEHFARLVADGATNVGAYREAFPARAAAVRAPHEQARRILRRPAVAARVAELRALADAEARAALAELACDLGIGIALGAAASGLSETRAAFEQKAVADSGRDLRLREFIMCFASARAPMAPRDDNGKICSPPAELPSGPSDRG